MNGEALMWLIPFLVIALMMWAVVRDNNRKRNRTVEEFERDVIAAKDSMLRAGMLELDKFAGNTNEKRAAVEYLKDEEQGMTKSGAKGDDSERTASEVLR